MKQDYSLIHLPYAIISVKKCRNVYLVAEEVSEEAEHLVVAIGRAPVRIFASLLLVQLLVQFFVFAWRIEYVRIYYTCVVVVED